ncbi:MAG: MFS transporter [Promethearchaeota archaeon]
MTFLQQSLKKKRTSFHSLNHNVKLVFLFTFTQSLGRGIWMGNVLSSFIYLLAGSSSELLGLTSAASGVAMTLVVFPAGIFSDRLRRDYMLRLAAIFGIISLVILFIATNLEMIFISLIIWGLYQGVTRPSLEALFADSIHSGSRSTIYSWRQLFGQIGMAIGPFLNIILFLILGDEWDLSILKLVMGVGLVFSLGSLLMMFLFSDHKSLGKESDSIASNFENMDQPNRENTIQNSKPEFQSAVPGKSKFKIPSLAGKYIPYLLVGCNIIIGLGAGMTVKFFPIFFMEIYGMSPIIVQIISGLTFIATGISGLVAQHFSKAKGRPQIIFIVQIISTLCLVIIATYPPFWLLIIVFIMRGSLMNASQPLSRSILMDIIPKKKRGKWNSMEALAWGLFWNFSAAVGGYLIGSANNFRRSFLVTAGVYVLGTLPILLLFRSVVTEK